MTWLRQNGKKTLPPATPCREGSDYSCGGDVGGAERKPPRASLRMSRRKFFCFLSEGWVLVQPVLFHQFLQFLVRNVGLV